MEHTLRVLKDLRQKIAARLMKAECEPGPFGDVVNTMLGYGVKLAMSEITAEIERQEFLLDEMAAHYEAEEAQQ